MSPSGRIDHAVEEFYFFGPYGRIRGFKDDRHIVEAGIVDKTSEKLHAEGAFSNLRVPVYTGTELSQVIIQMKGLEIAAAYDFIKSLPRLNVAFFIRKVIPCRIRMACIDAHSDP